MALPRSCLQPLSLGEYLAAIPVEEREGVWRWLAGLSRGLRRGSRIIDFRYCDGFLGDEWEPVSEDPDLRAWLVRRRGAVRHGIPASTVDGSRSTVSETDEQ